MQRTDLPMLTARLAELAEALPPHRVPSDRAVTVWLDALASYTRSEVQTALTDWPRYRDRMPVPSQVAAMIDERRAKAEKHADQAEADAERQRVADGHRPMRVKPWDRHEPTDVGRAELAKIAEINARPAPHRLAWILRTAYREARSVDDVPAVMRTWWREVARVAPNTDAGEFVEAERRRIEEARIRKQQREAQAAVEVCQ